MAQGKDLQKVNNQPLQHFNEKPMQMLPRIAPRKFPAIKSALHLKIGPPQKRAVVTPAYNAE